MITPEEIEAFAQRLKATPTEARPVDLNELDAKEKNSRRTLGDQLTIPFASIPAPSDHKTSDLAVHPVEVTTQEKPSFILKKPTEPVVVASFVEINDNGQPNFGFHKWQIDQAIRKSARQPAQENSKEVHPLTKAVLELTTSPYARPITLDEYKKLSPEQQAGLNKFLELKPFDVTAPSLVAIRLPISVGEKVFDMPYQRREKRAEEMFVMDVLVHQDPKTRQLQMYLAAGIESELEALAKEDDKRSNYDVAFIEQVKLGKNAIETAVSEAVRLISQRIANVAWNTEKYQLSVSQENIAKATEMIKAIFKTELGVFDATPQDQKMMEFKLPMPKSANTLDLEKAIASSQTDIVVPPQTLTLEELEKIATTEQNRLNVQRAIAKLKSKPNQ